MIVSAQMIALFAAALIGKALERVPRLEPPMRFAVASWYSLDGTGACGVGSVQSGYRFASLFLRCGTRVLFRGPAGEAVATMSDRGPYIGGRSFDLNANLRAVLGCPDLCVVRYRIGG